MTATSDQPEALHLPFATRQKPDELKPDRMTFVIEMVFVEEEVFTQIFLIFTAFFAFAQDVREVAERAFQFAEQFGLGHRLAHRIESDVGKCDGNG